MSQPARLPATYQDVLTAPDQLIAEILDGELSLQPRPGPKHAAVASNITADVLTFGRGRGGGGSAGWRILAEPELHLGADVVVPDVAGWHRSRMPQLPADAHISIPPDWVCEVVSPRTARADRTTKKRIYARSRVAWLWLVDPAAHTLEVLQLGGEFWQEVQLFSGNEQVNALPFDALSLDLALWWEGQED